MIEDILKQLVDAVEGLTKEVQNLGAEVKLVRVLKENPRHTVPATTIDKVEDEIAAQREKQDAKGAKAEPKKDKEPPATEVTEQPDIAEVRKALASVGREVGMGILADYGCTKLSELPEDKYAEVLRQAEKVAA